MADAPSAYPLTWPIGRPRTREWRGAQFFTDRKDGKKHQVSNIEAIERLERQLASLKASEPMLSSNLELRLNGQPRLDRGEPADPGVALYFKLAGKPMALASDKYRLVAQNIAAIAAHIEATRRIERYGIATTEQMFTGFLALPAPLVIDDWRAALGNPLNLADAEIMFRERMKTAHPDVGGSHTRAAILTAAIKRAREVLR
jgi:hypothetical protein